MSPRTPLFKIIDDEAGFWCSGGNGIMREEAWVNEDGKVVRYNLAFLMPHKTSVDHGRILGYDNAHGIHERHLLGKVIPVPYDDYPARAEQFYLEVEALRRQYEDKDIC